MVRSVTFPELVSATFDQIRQSAQSSVAVSIRLLEAIGAVAPFVGNVRALDALKDQADRVRNGIQRDRCADADLDDIDRSYRTVLGMMSAAIEDGSGGSRSVNEFSK